MPGFPKLPSIIFKRSPSEVPSAFDSGRCHPVPQYPQALSRAPRSMSGFYSFSPDEKPFPEAEDGASQASNQLTSLPDSWLLQADPRAGTQEESDDLNMRSHYAATYSEGQWEMPVASTSYSAPQHTPSQLYAPHPHPYDTHEMAGYPAYSYSQQYPHSSLQTGMPAPTISPHAYTHSLPTTPSQLYATAQHSPQALPSVVNSPHATGSPYNQPSPMSASTPTAGPSTSTSSIHGLTHKEQLQKFKQAVVDYRGPTSVASGPFVPQVMYKPHTSSDRRRYVEEVTMDEPIVFHVEHPSEVGIPLVDAMHMRVKRLVGRDETVFQGRGPSVSVRLEWPGYRPWSRQIPTKDFRSPPGPITRAKLAKNVAKCVQRFIAERQSIAMEDDGDPKWRVGSSQGTIRVEDLVLVSLHHVSMGSWQPHLRLRRQLPP